MSTNEKSTGLNVKQRLKELQLQRPSDDKPFVVKVKPFKARRDRHSLPIKKGQGITINGWQFEVRTVQANGTVYLKPIGRIIEEPVEVKATAHPPGGEVPNDG